MNRDDESLHAPFDPVRDSLLSMQSSDWDWLDQYLEYYSESKDIERVNGLRSTFKEVRAGLDKPVSHKPLPVPGYKIQDDKTIMPVGNNKLAEERILRMIDEYQKNPDIDQRWLAKARTAIEEGFMFMNRAIFQPTRVKLPEDR